MALPLRWSFPATFRALQEYNYRLYWFGLLVSQIGTWMQTVGQAWLVLEITGSPVALGAVTALQALPIFLLTLFAGVLVDRVPKHRLLIVTQSTAMIQAFVLAALTLGGVVQIWEVYVLAFLLGLTNALDIPGRQAFVVELVGRDNLVNAIGLNSTLFNSARLVGPGVGGLIIAAIGPGGCFLLNGFSFLAVIVSLIKMRPAEFHQTPHLEVHAAVLSQLREGLSYAMRTRPVVLALLLMAAIGTFGYNFNVVLPLLARDALNVGAVGFGAMTSAVGLGSLVSALVVASRGRASSRTMLVGATAFSAGLALVALSPSYLLTLGLFVAVGMAGLTFTATANSTIQLNVPDALRGRVMSIYVLLLAGSTPIGGFITGVLADAVGIRAALAADAAVCFVGVGAALLYRRRAPAPIKGHLK